MKSVLGMLVAPRDVTDTLRANPVPGGVMQNSDVLVRTVELVHAAPPMLAVLPLSKLVPTIVKASPPATAPGRRPIRLEIVGVGAM